jgi:hypothetical protein
VDPFSEVLLLLSGVDLASLDLEAEEVRPGELGVTELSEMPHEASALLLEEPGTDALLINSSEVSNLATGRGMLSELRCL